MPNSEQLRILQESGLDAWNRFSAAQRRENAQWRANLRLAKLDAFSLAGADLTNADLRHSKLSSADLSNADLSGAWLSFSRLVDADLIGTDLSNADLNNADLSKADLRNAFLAGADLRGADLVEAHLCGANLTDANLQGANLRNARLDDAELYDADLSSSDLSGTCLKSADLRSVNLYKADLSDANLRGASLWAADLRQATLQDADLAGAELEDANLSHANLRGADLLCVTFGSTIMVNVDLQTASLKSTQHSGPSNIDTHSLALNRGTLPSDFLRGCGLADWEIEAAKLYNPDISNDDRITIAYEITRLQGLQPLNMNRIFISYTRTDSPFVDAIEKRFDSKGVRYWRDVHEMKAGRLEKQIDRAITLSRRVLLVLSERSVLSDWVESEARKARDIENEYRREGKPTDVLCPVALDDSWKTCDWPARLRNQIEEYNILDFSNWRDDATMERQFAKLYSGLILNYQD